MGITAKEVKELRERTGAGMMECKKALVEADGDIEAAIDAMRKSGVAKAAKRSGKIAAEGMIVMLSSDDGARTVLLEVNSETDFVSKGDDFQSFARAAAECALKNGIDSIEALSNADFGEGKTFDVARQELIAKIGENIGLRRVTVLEPGDNTIGTYQHGSPARIGVVVELQGGDVDLARDIAMHVAASRPLCLSADQVPAETLEKEKDIIRAQALESGKPPEIVEKMIGGRLNKFLNEVTLLGQPFVKDPDQTIEKLLKSAGAQVMRFERYEVGEGIEKKTENFADEVMAQAKGS